MKYSQLSLLILLILSASSAHAILPGSACLGTYNRKPKGPENSFYINLSGASALDRVFEDAVVESRDYGRVRHGKDGDPGFDIEVKLTGNHRKIRLEIEGKRKFSHGGAESYWAAFCGGSYIHSNRYSRVIDIDLEKHKVAYIDTTGGHGNDGGSGDLAGNGGNGGDGGDIVIYYADESLLDYVMMNTPRGGHGGQGGKGTVRDYWFDSDDGTDGLRGRDGVIEFVYDESLERNNLVH